MRLRALRLISRRLTEMSRRIRIRGISAPETLSRIWRHSSSKSPLTCVASSGVKGTEFSKYFSCPWQGRPFEGAIYLAPSFWLTLSFGRISPL